MVGELKQELTRFVEEILLVVTLSREKAVTNRLVSHQHLLLRLHHFGQLGLHVADLVVEENKGEHKKGQILFKLKAVTFKSAKQVLWFLQILILIMT